MPRASAEEKFLESLNPKARKVYQEACAIRALLELRPRFKKGWRKVKLGADEPTVIRALYAGLGWSPLFRPDLEPPELKTSRTLAQRQLAEYASWGNGFKLTLRDLPRRFRVVSVDEQGVGFGITDEKDDGDPRTLAVLADENKIMREEPSYLRRVGATALRVAFEEWTIDAFPRTVPKGGEELFPTLAPLARKLSEDRWVLPEIGAGNGVIIARRPGKK